MSDCRAVTGPWKGGRGAGRARRGASAIVGSKNRVRVPNFGSPEIVAQIGQRTANIGISTGYVDNLRQNQLFVVNIIRKNRDTFKKKYIVFLTKYMLCVIIFSLR